MEPTHASDKVNSMMIFGRCKSIAIFGKTIYSFPSICLEIQPFHPPFMNSCNQIEFIVKDNAAMSIMLVLGAW